MRRPDQEAHALVFRFDATFAENRMLKTGLMGKTLGPLIPLKRLFSLNGWLAFNGTFLIFKSAYISSN